MGFGVYDSDPPSQKFAATPLPVGYLPAIIGVRIAVCSGVCGVLPLHTADVAVVDLLRHLPADDADQEVGELAGDVGGRHQRQMVPAVPGPRPLPHGELKQVGGPSVAMVHTKVGLFYSLARVQ